jgi:acyl CoA:acetate/3-ketoacid CoA transferase beta subunit
VAPWISGDAPAFAAGVASATVSITSENSTANTVCRSPREICLAVVVTDLGILEPGGEAREPTLTRVHPGIDGDRVREASGWELRVADEVHETHPPTEQELEALGALRTKGDRRIAATPA